VLPALCAFLPTAQNQVKQFFQDFYKPLKSCKYAPSRLILYRAAHKFRQMDFSSRIHKYLDTPSTVHPSAFIAPGAIVIGDVTLAEESSVWPAAVLRGDINRIVIGPRSNIQDGAVVHLADEFGTFVGELVTVGHKAVLHACTIADEVLVGMGAIVLDGAEIGARSIIGAGALVTGGKKIPPGSLVLGSPAKVVRTLPLDEQAGIRVWAERYVQLSRFYLERATATR
jgi:carbonic anhydrase/acetyltransferase-like protein (isoleucine patch superfamily)